MLPFEEEMKKIFLAGIGAVAATMEKSQEIVAKLVDKGELTVEQGRVINEELKHNFQDSSKPHVEPEGAANLFAQLEKLSPGEIAKLKQKLDAMENSGSET